MRTKNEKPSAKKPEAVNNDKPRTALEVKLDSSRTQHQQFAEISVSPVLRGIAAAKPWIERQSGEVGINEAYEVAQRYADAAASGNLDFAKSMLVAQAITLDAIFNDMMGRAAGLIKTEGGRWTFTGDTMEVVTRIGFKAQSQCRTTLQTLGELVNPRTVVIAKQANMATGPQQVNNGASPTRAQEIGTPANELLEANPSERLDPGTQGTAGRVDPWLATVGALKRPADAQGKVHQLQECKKARAA